MDRSENLYLLFTKITSHKNIINYIRKSIRESIEKFFEKECVNLI